MTSFGGTTRPFIMPYAGSCLWCSALQRCAHTSRANSLLWTPRPLRIMVATPADQLSFSVPDVVRLRASPDFNQGRTSTCSPPARHARMVQDRRSASSEYIGEGVEAPRGCSGL